MIKFQEMFEKAKKVTDKEHEKIFNGLLKKYKARGIDDLSDKDKKKFFNELDKMIDADKETD